MRSFAFCLFLALALPCAAHAAPQTATPAFEVADGAFFALSTSDIGRSVEWYTGKLGLKVILEPPADEKVTVVVLEGGGLMVELIQHGDARPSGTGPLAHGIFKAGFVVDDFDRTVELLRARGVKFVAGPFPARNRQRANAVFEDDSGNLIQVFGK